MRQVLWLSCASVGIPFCGIWSICRCNCIRLLGNSLVHRTSGQQTYSCWSLAMACRSFLWWLWLTPQYWVDIPMIPFMLIVGQLPIMANFSTWLPTLVAFPVTSTPSPARNTLMLYRYAGIAAEPRRYPPSPFLTVCVESHAGTLYTLDSRGILHSETFYFPSSAAATTSTARFSR